MGDETRQGGQQGRIGSPPVPNSWGRAGTRAISLWFILTFPRRKNEAFVMHERGKQRFGTQRDRV